MKMIRGILLIFPLLTSCSNASIYKELFESISNVIKPPNEVSIDRINSIPYASLQARIGRSQNILIVLEEVNQDIFKWTSSNLVKVYTKNGYVIKLTGIGNDLDFIDLDKNHPAIDGNFRESQELTSFYTFSNPSLFRLPVKTKFTYLGKEEVEILGKKIQSDVYKENSLNNLISWKFENIFWIDKSGEVVKSEQNFTPKNPKIFLSYGKKYKKPD